MQKKRIACMVMVCVLLIGAMAVPASAEETSPVVEDILSFDLLSPLATNSFSMSISANSTTLANSSISLLANETITFKALYTPTSASVDVGFIAPDGKFYYFTATGGVIDQTMKVNQSGEYTIQFRNKSNAKVEVIGYVNY